MDKEFGFLSSGLINNSGGGSVAAERTVGVRKIAMKLITFIPTHSLPKFFSLLYYGAFYEKE